MPDTAPERWTDAVCDGTFNLRRQSGERLHMRMHDSRRYVVHPSVSVVKSGGRLRVANPAFGTWLETSSRAGRLIEFFRRPARLSAAPGTRALAADETLLRTLIDNFMLVPHAELPLLTDARTRRVPRAIGTECSATALALAARRGTFVVIGVPLDSGARDGGARHGPEEIRRAFPPELRGLNGGERGHPVLDLDFGREHDLERLHVLDLGDLDFRPGESLAVVGARLAKFVVRCADLGATPVVLGGDHSISAFSVAALLERRRALGIIHFDAHHDLYAHPLRQLSHATPFAHLLAHRSLRRLLQIGLRTMERPPPGTRRVRDSRLRYVSARSVARLSPARIFRGMDRELPYYLSFDVDCLDPAFASATATRVIGGLSYPQAVDLVDYAARRFDIVGADFVETSKNGQEFNSAAAASARCVLQLFLSRCRTRRLSSYNFVYPP